MMPEAFNYGDGLVTVGPTGGSAGVEPNSSWTPLEALGVALRAVDKAEDDIYLPYNCTASEAMTITLQQVRVALAQQFVKEGV